MFLRRRECQIRKALALEYLTLVLGFEHYIVRMINGSEGVKFIGKNDAADNSLPLVKDDKNAGPRFGCISPDSSKIVNIQENIVIHIGWVYTSITKPDQ